MKKEVLEEIREFSKNILEISEEPSEDGVFVYQNHYQYFKKLFPQVKFAAFTRVVNLYVSPDNVRNVEDFLENNKITSAVDNTLSGTVYRDLDDSYVTSVCIVTVLTDGERMQSDVINFLKDLLCFRVAQRKVDDWYK